MEDKIGLVLRDRTPGAKKCFLVKVEYEGYNFDKPLDEFFQKIKKQTNGVLDGRPLDIYIGIWAQQASLKLSSSFVTFCGNHGIPIEVDFND